MDEQSERNLCLLVEEIRESEDVITRISTVPTSTQMLKQLDEIRFLELDIDLVAHIIYPQLHLEYVLYRERATRRVRMVFLN